MKSPLLILALLATLAPTCLAQTSQVEEIIIARSWRESRVAPTAYCGESRTHFGNVLFEDRYTFYSVQTRASDGQIVNAKAGRIGTMRACFGSTADSSTVTFYAEGSFGSMPYVGNGSCLRAKYNYPEQGMQVLRCFLDLSGLPKNYLGGMLTTNSLVTRALLGGPSDPPGYTQPSIATIRLWKHR
jgi:hypothetical protein